MNNQPDLNNQDQQGQQSQPSQPAQQWQQEQQGQNGQPSGGQYPPPNYTQQYAPDPFAQKTTPPGRGFAIASLVFGILSATGLCCCCFMPPVAIVFGALAIVFAIIYSSRASKLDGMALAGLILGIIGVVIALFLIIFTTLNSGVMTEAMEEFMREFQSQYPDIDINY